MKYFGIEFATRLHDDIIDEIGGLKGYNKVQIGYLISALEQIQNDEFYPEFVDKLTHLIFACVKFHPFLDGNKRSAIYLGEHFARLNGFDFDDSFFAKMEEIVIQIAENSLSKEKLKEFLIANFLA